MKVLLHTGIYKSGNEYVDIEIRPAEVDVVDCTSPLFRGNGGLFVSFLIDHVNCKTSANVMHLEHGEWINDEIIEPMEGCFTEEDCLKFCEEEYGNERTRETQTSRGE